MDLCMDLCYSIILCIQEKELQNEIYNRQGRLHFELVQPPWYNVEVFQLICSGHKFEERQRNVTVMVEAP